MKYTRFKKDGKVENPSILKGISAALIYSNIDSDFRRTIEEILSQNKEINVFGTTSFTGVFTPEGFIDTGAILSIHPEDNISLYPVLRKTSKENAREISTEASLEVKKGLNGKVDFILLHATPGYEEEIVNGIVQALGDNVPVYGGSAADNTLEGKWKLFLNQEMIEEGLLIVGFSYNKKIYHSFYSGYLPTDKKGVITKAKGRIIYEIENKPAAIVYNEWTKGGIKDNLGKDNIILGLTTLHPVGRVVGKLAGLNIYLLSHPHMVLGNENALSFFTEFKEGEEIVLMFGSENALIERTEQVATRALGQDKDKVKLKGGILIYCGGCVGAVKDKDKIVESYKKVVKDMPFIGAATFGEQGHFSFGEVKNRHGNLMCNTVLFQD